MSTTAERSLDVAMKVPHLEGAILRASDAAPAVPVNCKAGQVRLVRIPNDLRKFNVIFDSSETLICTGYELRGCDQPLTTPPRAI